MSKVVANTLQLGSSATPANNLQFTVPAVPNGNLLLQNLAGAVGLANYSNDSAAATGGVPIGGLYRNGSVVMIRVA